VRLEWNGKSDGTIRCKGKISPGNSKEFPEDAIPCSVLPCRKFSNVFLKFTRGSKTKKILYNTREMTSETSTKFFTTFRYRNVDDYPMNSYKNISLLVDKWWTVRELGVNRLVFCRSYSCVTSRDSAKTNIYIYIVGAYKPDFNMTI